MEEKRKGRPRKNPQSESDGLYRSDPEDLEKLKEERLERMKKFLRGGAAMPDKSDGRDKTDLRANSTETAENLIPEQEAKEIKNTFEGSFAQISEAQREIEEISGLCNKSNEYADAILAKCLTDTQIQVLEKVCRTDELIDDMLAALEDAGANQRWLTAAKANFQCAIMEVYRAILKPKGL